MPPKPAVVVKRVESAATTPKGKQTLQIPAAAPAVDQQSSDSLSSSPPAAPLPPSFDLQTCSAQEYLSRTIYPLLAPALEIVDQVRPVDPVEYLALILAKESSTQNERVQQLNEIHNIREQLRTQYKKEYSVEGRV